MVESLNNSPGELGERGKFMKKYIFLLNLFLLFLFTSCGEQEKIDNIQSEIPVEIKEKVNENLEIDAIIGTRPVKKEYSIYDLKIKTSYDQQTLQDLFFSGEEVTVLKEEAYGEVTMKTEHKTLHVGGYFQFYTDYYINALSVIEYMPLGDNRSRRTDFEGYPYAEELEGFSKESAVTRAEEVMEKLNIQFYETPVICTGVTVETFKAFAEEPAIQEYFAYYNLEMPQYGKEDEFYYMVYPFVIEDTVMFDNRYRSDKTNISSLSDCGSYVVLCVGRDEIYQVATGLNYQTEEGNKSKPKKLIAFSKVIDSVTEYFDHYILDDIITVKKIDFAYLAVNIASGKRQAVPVWIIYADDSEEIYQTKGTVLFVNALTGELIYL